MTDHHHHHPRCIIMSYSSTTSAHDLPFWRSTVLHDPPSTLFWIYDTHHARAKGNFSIRCHHYCHHGKTLLEVLARYTTDHHHYHSGVHHHVIFPLLPLPMTCHSGEALCSTILLPLSFGLMTCSMPEPRGTFLP